MGTVEQVGKNSAEEFFETIIMMVGYEESKKIIQGFTKDIENPILKEAVESSMNVLTFGFIMQAVRTQEAFVSKIFHLVEVLGASLIADPAKRALAKMRKFKGVKLFRRMGFFQGSNQDNIMTAGIIFTHAGNYSRQQGVSSSTSMGSSLDLMNSTKNSLYNREQLHMGLGNNMASRYNETLMFKLFTKSFTAQDTTLMKKILGRDTASVLDVNDLNKAADFMYTKDSNGKLTGLSEEFMNLINALAYVHNK
ncbi:hypothetical protein SJPD1_0767 [Sulfurospirillum diekertiae]|uniref:Uncharacterized protein n=1 Tax=Sulfurospirillum diekertiae TaxID=1854492 RepID=A0A290HCC7_9BACT|nr:hypothetical protein [Sulfurospirillum diekertiae]ATB68881.1 hypothetical protein SJPD1_0767 [Sulfurospirillum diekertiae]